MSSFVAGFLCGLALGAFGLCIAFFATSVDVRTLDEQQSERIRRELKD